MLPLILGLIMQVGLSQSNFATLAAAESIVRGRAAPAAADAGGFTDSIRADMAVRLSNVCGVSAADIHISADSKPNTDGYISYQVTVPIRRLVAAPGLFGVKSANNTGRYKIEGTAYARIEDEPKEEKEPTTTESSITQDERSH
jgi:hypothetical protein